MLLKTLGITLIIAGCGSWGLLGARRIDKRVAQIKDLRMALGFLEKEITYIHTPLSRALERTARFCGTPVSCLFTESSKGLEAREGITAGEAWMKGLQALKNNAELKAADLDILSTAALQLGMSDVGEQKKFFSLIQEELQIQEEKALQEVESGRKLWAYGGFIVGAMIVLLLL
jgi:stage III sporulation protein AB